MVQIYLNSTREPSRVDSLSVTRYRLGLDSSELNGKGLIHDLPFQKDSGRFAFPESVQLTRHT